MSDADRNPPECRARPECVGIAMERVIQRVAHTFKGGSPTPRFHRGS